MTRGRVSTSGSRSAPFGKWRTIVVMLAIVFSLIVPSALPAEAAVGTLYATQLTGARGAVWMGNHLWVAEHDRGFCRLDVTAAGTFAVNRATCNLAAVSPGQPAFDSLNNLVYLPDHSGNSQGVWRLQFDPITETVGGAVLLAPRARLGQMRPKAVALGPDGNLYVGFSQSGDIKRITTPGQGSWVVQVVGRASTGKKVAGMAFVGADLYLVEDRGITRIPQATVAKGAKPQLTGIVAPSPDTIVSDRNDVLYIGNSTPTGSVVVQYVVSSGAQAVLASAGTLATGAATAFVNIESLALDASGGLYVGDDPSGVSAPLQAVVWKVPGNTALFADDLAAPESTVWVGNHLWAAVQGTELCRLDADGEGYFQLSERTCVALGASAGQMAYDPRDGFVYVPDKSADSQGVWRLQANTEAGLLLDPVLLAPEARLGASRPSAVAVGRDGNIYIGFTGSGEIKRIVDPATDTQAIEEVGRTSDGKGISGLAFVRDDLYIAESGAVAKIATVREATDARAQPTAINVNGPMAIASDRINTIFVADRSGNLSTVLRYNVEADVQDVYATRCIDPAYQDEVLDFASVTNLALDPAGNVFVADSPTSGPLAGDGHIYRIPAGTTPEIPGLSGRPAVR
ncbi:MAG: hypothetical protein HY675_29370 [Chloroflexi bacterium]|nr:hypothetical protein [Chloroflexota bacterium]